MTSLQIIYKIFYNALTELNGFLLFCFCYYCLFCHFIYFFGGRTAWLVCMLPILQEVEHAVTFVTPICKVHATPNRFFV